MTYYHLALNNLMKELNMSLTIFILNTHSIDATMFMVRNELENFLPTQEQSDIVQQMADLALRLEKTMEQ